MKERCAALSIIALRLTFCSGDRGFIAVTNAVCNSTPDLLTSFSELIPQQAFCGCCSSRRVSDGDDPYSENTLLMNRNLLRDDPLYEDTGTSSCFSQNYLALIYICNYMTVRCTMLISTESTIGFTITCYQCCCSCIFLSSGGFPLITLVVFSLASSLVFKNSVSSKVPNQIL